MQNHMSSELRYLIAGCGEFALIFVAILGHVGEDIIEVPDLTRMLVPKNHNEQRSYHWSCVFKKWKKLERKIQTVDHQLDLDACACLSPDPPQGS